MVFKKTIKRSSPVIVETKKYGESGCCNSGGKKCFGILVIILLLLNLVIGVLNYFKAGSAWDIEALKVGGNDNLQLVKKLYEMDTYKQQQKGAIMQVLSSFAGGGAQQQQVAPIQQDPQQLLPEAQTVTQ